MKKSWRGVPIKQIRSAIEACNIIEGVLTKYFEEGMSAEEALEEIDDAISFFSASKPGVKNESR